MFDDRLQKLSIILRTRWFSIIDQYVFTNYKADHNPKTQPTLIIHRLIYFQFGLLFQNPEEIYLKSQVQ